MFYSTFFVFIPNIGKNMKDVHIQTNLNPKRRKRKKKTLTGKQRCDCNYLLVIINGIKTVLIITNISFVDFKENTSRIQGVEEIVIFLYST